MTIFMLHALKKQTKNLFMIPFLFQNLLCLRENTKKGEWRIWECEKVSLLKCKRMSRGLWMLGGIPYI